MVLVIAYLTTDTVTIRGASLHTFACADNTNLTLQAVDIRSACPSNNRTIIFLPCADRRSQTIVLMNALSLFAGVVWNRVKITKHVRVFT